MAADTLATLLRGRAIKRPTLLRTETSRALIVGVGAWRSWQRFCGWQRSRSASAC